MFGCQYPRHTQKPLVDAPHAKRHVSVWVCEKQKLTELTVLMEILEEKVPRRGMTIK